MVDEVYLIVFIRRVKERKGKGRCVEERQIVARLVALDQRRSNDEQPT